MERASRTSYQLLLAGVFLWCVSIFIPPIESMLTHASGFTSSVAYQAFSTICHQYDSRSIHLGGVKLAVCSRCAAIYCSFFFGVTLWRLFAKARSSFSSSWWIVALVPMFADVLFDMLNLHPSNFLTRSVTGALFGITAGFLLTPLFLRACADLSYHFNQRQGISYEPKA